MSNVTVVLSGCGVYDGAKINAAVLTLLCLEQQGASYAGLAPNIEQMHVINHLTGEPTEGETRNVLVQAARIARGNILYITQAKAEDFEAPLLPGGAHLQCPVSEARVGVTHKLFTTPAYMLAGREAEAYTDDSACVREALALA